MKDAIAYMDWKRVVPWKILSLVARPNELPVPVGYGARNLNFPENLKQGSQIWVVTRIANQFSLAGKVVIQEILDRKEIPEEKWPEELKGLFKKWRFVARADPAKSQFFETNNAGPVIREHQICFAQNRTIAYSNVSLSESFASCLAQARKTVFLSYRWEEGRRFAFALAKEFRKKGYSPWLDALSIPRYQASREPEVTAPRLKKLIEFGIEASKFAVVINTSTYADRSWTKMEFEYIRRTGIPWLQVMRGGRKKECNELPIFKRKPDDVVQEILKHIG